MTSPYYGVLSVSALVAQLYGTRPRGAYCDACTFIGAWQSMSALVAQLYDTRPCGAYFGCHRFGNDCFPLFLFTH